MDERISWVHYFMKIATVVQERSTCLRRKVGAVLVRDNQILATGYNGAPKGVSHCSTTGCLREQLNIPSGERHELCRGTHAEQNAIIEAAYNGVSIKNSTLFCTLFPCSICAKMLINAGVKVIYYAFGYPSDLAVQLLTEAGIFCFQIDMNGV